MLVGPWANGVKTTGNSKLDSGPSAVMLPSLLPLILVAPFAGVLAVALGSARFAEASGVDGWRCDDGWAGCGLAARAGSVRGQDGALAGGVAAGVGARFRVAVRRAGAVVQVSSFSGSA